MTTGRVAAAVALLVLAGALVAALAGSTPWDPLAGMPAPSGDPVGVDVRRDFTEAEIRREDAYHRAVRPPVYAGLVAGILVALALGLTPWGARVVAGAARPLGGGWGWQVVLGGIAVSAVGALVTLPFDARAEVVLRRYGLSTQTWGSWALDRLKGFALSAGLLALALLALYALIRALPTWWWAPAAVGGALLVLAVSFGYPVVVEPVFNRFTPMADGPLRASLLELAEQDGVPVDDVLVADASRRTTSLNAYVSGYGATRRIVVYDTLLERASADEVRSVVAHELGHADANDVGHFTLVGALGLATGVCLLYLAITSPVLLGRAGVATPADPTSLALVLAVFAVVGLAATPVQSLVSRRIEARADVHALELTRDAATFVAMQRRLSTQNLSDLDPPALAYAVFASHPTAPERIALAREWARRTGQQLP